MKLVRHLLDAKGTSIISISPDASVFEAINTMADESIGSLVVMDPRGRLVGIVTERDYARKVILKGRSSENTHVSEIMSAEVFTTSTAATVRSCMELMNEHRIRHLPVVEEGSVVGVISIGDLVNAIISEQQEEIDRFVDQRADIRQELPKYANWPTFPQLYVKGELIGGSDIVVEMYHSGELKTLLEGADNE